MTQQLHLFWVDIIYSVLSGENPPPNYKTTLRDSVREGLISTATQELDYYLQLNSEYIFSYGSHSKSKPVSELLLILH